MVRKEHLFRFCKEVDKDNFCFSERSFHDAYGLGKPEGQNVSDRKAENADRYYTALKVSCDFKNGRETWSPVFWGSWTVKGRRRTGSNRGKRGGP